MDVNNTMDQYEKQLYSLFTSYDVNHNGNLSRGALHELCDALQLDDRGKLLINLLCKDNAECNISFQEFRDGLLTVLGNETYDRPMQRIDQNENNSGEESSGREVSPKFVFGSKKYGRRSRPAFKADPVNYIPGDLHGTNNSSNEFDDLENTSNSHKKASKVRRSVSLNDGRKSDYFDFNSSNTPDNYLTHLSITKVENIDLTSNLAFNTLDCNSNSQKSLFKSLSYDASSTQQQLEENPIQEEEDLLPSENIIELWESIGITQPQQLLQDLGFQSLNVKLSEVIGVLEDEIKMLINNLQESSASHSLIMLFQAILCLYRCETKSLKLRLNHTVAERNKLKSDLSDANQRAILLAHEVDENHTNMENIMRQNIKQLEMKHADVVKQIMGELTSEKETSSLTIVKLEKRIVTLESEETKLKSEIANLQEDNLKLEKELNKSQEQLYELTDIKNYLTKELKMLGDERQKIQTNPMDESELLRLERQLAKHQAENIALQDKNDELCTELDAVKGALSMYQPKILEVNNASQYLTSQMSHMNSFSSTTSANSSLPSHIELKVKGEDECDFINQSATQSGAQNDVAISSELSSHISEEPSSKAADDAVDKESPQLDNKICLIINYGDVNVEFIEKALEKLTLDPSEEVLDLKSYVLCLYALIIKTKSYLKNLLKSPNVIDGDKDIKTNLSINLSDVVNELLKYSNDNGQVDELFDIFSNFNRKGQITLYQPAKESVADLNLKFEIDKLNECLKQERLQRDEERIKEAEKYQELESNMDLLKNEYFKCEEYWSSKLNEEREIYDTEQRITDEKFTELLTKLSEYEEQFTMQDSKTDRYGGPLSTIEEKCHLEKQFNDLEDEFEEYKAKAEKKANEKDILIHELKDKIIKLEESVKNAVNIEKNSQNNCHLDDETKANQTSNSVFSDASNSLSETEGHVVNSPISYLWTQKAIPSPISNIKSSSESQRDYHNPAYIKGNHTENSNGLPCIVTPIQKPVSSKINDPNQDCSVVNSNVELKHETKMLNCSDLEEALQGRKKQPQVEGTFGRVDTDVQSYNIQKPNIQNHNNSVILRTVALEIHCRQLQAALRQQQAYAEGVYQQTVAAHRAEMGALKQRLAAADLLVRDLYVENCHLARNINNPMLK